MDVLINECPSNLTPVLSTSICTHLLVYKLGGVMGDGMLMVTNASDQQ